MVLIIQILNYMEFFIFNAMAISTLPYVCFQVEFKIVSGGTELVSIVHPTPVCLGEFYNIDIFLSAIEQRLTVGIVNEENTAELRQEQIASPLTMRDTAYVGYVDPSASGKLTFDVSVLDEVLDCMYLAVMSTC